MHRVTIGASIEMRCGGAVIGGRVDWEDAKPLVFELAYGIGALATLVYLLAFSPGHFNAWNWLIVVPLDIFLSGIWPVYWLLHFIL